MCAETVKVNGVLLASDMFQAGLSRDKLLNKISEKGKFEVPAISTLRRAAAGGPIEIEMLKAIAHGLGYPISRYQMVEEDIPTETLCNIGGAWEGYYIEVDMDRKNFGLVSSEMSITQNGPKLYITSTDIENKTNIERSEGIIDAMIVRDILMLRSRVVGWQPPFGFSCTLLKISHGDEMMRGHAVWYDLDTQGIETSKCAYVRSTSQDREPYLDLIRKDLEKEIKLRTLSS